MFNRNLSISYVLFHLRTLLCKNQIKWEMKIFDPPLKFGMQIDLQVRCSKTPFINVLTSLLPW